MDAARKWLNKNSTKLIYELNEVQLGWVCHALQQYADEAENRGMEQGKLIGEYGSESYIE